MLTPPERPSHKRTSCPTPQVLLPLVATLVLCIAMVQRVASLYHMNFALDEHLLYGMSAVPEVVHAALFAVPFLMGRLAMCYNWEDHLHMVQQGRAAAANPRKGSASKIADNLVISADGNGGSNDGNSPA